MLHKCANPACASLFRSLSHGKLFLLETGNADSPYRIASPHRRGRLERRTERYWLCDICCCQLTLAFERGRGMVTVPLPPRNTPAPAVHLTQMHPAGKGYRAEMKGAL